MQAVLMCLFSSSVRQVFVPSAEKPQPNPVLNASSAKTNKFAAQKPQVMELLRGVLDSSQDKSNKIASKAASAPPLPAVSSSVKLSSNAGNAGTALLSLLTKKPVTAPKPASNPRKDANTSARAKPAAKPAEQSTNLIDRFPALANAISAGQNQPKNQPKSKSKPKPKQPKQPKQKQSKRHKQEPTPKPAEKQSSAALDPVPLPSLEARLREAGQRLDGAAKTHAESAERIRSIHASIDAKLTAHMEKLHARIQAENAKRQKLEEERVKRLLAAVSNTLNTQVPKQLSSLVDKAVKTEILPTLQQKLTHTLDLRLKKIVPDICSNVAKQLQPLLEKGLVQRVEKQVTTQLHKSILSAFERSFNKVVTTVE